MPRRIASEAVRAPTKPKAAPKAEASPRASRPPISVSVALTKKLDKAMINPGTLASTHLKFSTTKGHQSPSGNPLQVVYLLADLTKNGMYIAYVDSKDKQFWAQSPGVSGVAQGPFKLPAGVDKELAKITANVLKEGAGERLVAPKGFEAPERTRPFPLTPDSGGAWRSRNVDVGYRGGSMGWNTGSGGGSSRGGGGGGSGS